MNNGLSVLALLLGLAGAGLGGYALLQERADPAEARERIAALEERVERLQRQGEDRRADAAPSLTSGISIPTRTQAPAEGSAVDVVAEGGETGGPTSAQEGPITEAAVQTLVDKAVQKKAAQMRTMRNKKPSLDAFAKVLELTEAQRAAAERQIAQSQHDIRSILETPADDGTVFLDEVVETMALGMAKPGQARAAWGKLIGRLTSEKVPGTDETYAVRAEAVKSRLRESFQRDWSKQQYATFEEWKMDPTEVQGVENSAWSDLQEVIVARARELGAETPGDE